MAAGAQQQCFMKHVTLESSTDVLSGTRCHHGTLTVWVEILDNNNQQFELTMKFHKDFRLYHIFAIEYVVIQLQGGKNQNPCNFNTNHHQA